MCDDWVYIEFYKSSIPCHSPSISLVVLNTTLTPGTFRSLLHKYKGFLLRYQYLSNWTVICNQGLVECIYLLMNRAIPTHFCHVFLCSSTLATQMYFGRLWLLLTCIDSFFKSFELKNFYLHSSPPCLFKNSLNSEKTNYGNICKGCIILRGRPRKLTASAAPRRLSLVLRPRTTTASLSSAAYVWWVSGDEACWSVPNSSLGSTRCLPNPSISVCGDGFCPVFCTNLSIGFVSG